MAARDDDIVTRYYCQVIMIEMRQSRNLTQRRRDRRGRERNFLPL